MKRAAKPAAVLVTMLVAVFSFYNIAKNFGIIQTDYSYVSLVYEAEAEDRYYYSRLSENGKIAYTLVLPEIYRHSPKIEIPRLNDSDFNSLIYALSYDNPDLICFSGECRLQRTGGVYYFIPEYTHTSSEHDALMQRLESAAGKILSSQNRYSGEYAKELYLHDSLCEVCSYDYADTADLTVSSYDALVNGSAVCEGYAKAFKLLLDRAGIKSYLVTGIARDESGNTEGHMWNVVKLSGGNYYVDPTWDDMSVNEGLPESEHFYFNVNEQMLSRDHFEIEPSDNGCNSLAENYFNKNGSLYEAYNSLTRDALAKAICKGVRNGQNSCEMLFVTADAYAKAKKELVDEKKIFDVLRGAQRIDSRVNFTSVEFITSDEIMYIRFAFK